MTRLKMFTPEKLGMLALAACLLAFAVMAMGHGCSRHSASADVKFESAAAVADSMAAEADTIAPADRKPKKARKSKKAPDRKAPTPYSRNHLDESAQ